VDSNYTSCKRTCCWTEGPSNCTKIPVSIATISCQVCTQMPRGHTGYWCHWFNYNTKSQPLFCIKLKTIKGLHIVNLQENTISIDKHVQSEMARLWYSLLEISHAFLKDITSTFKVVFAMADLFINIWMMWNSILTLLRLILLAIVIFVCGTLTQMMTHHWKTNTNTDKTVNISWPEHDRHMDLLYTLDPLFFIRSFWRNQSWNWNDSFGCYAKISAASRGKLIKAVYNKHVYRSNAIFLGDFNIDYNKNSRIICTCINFKKLIKQPTNDFGSTIDLVFTNIETCQSGQSQAYYTDQRLCWIALWYNSIQPQLCKISNYHVLFIIWITCTLN